MTNETMPALTAADVPDLFNRAHWLEQRMATMDPRRRGLVFDEREYAQLLLAFRTLGIEYVPGPWAGYGRGQASGATPSALAPAADPGLDEPPLQSQPWSPGRDPGPRAQFPVRSPSRFFPRGT